MNRFGAMMAAMLAGAMSLLLPALAAPGQAADGEATDAQAPPPGAMVTEEGWFAPIKPKYEKRPLPEQITKAFIIPVHEPISTKTLDAIERKAIRCRGNGAQLIVLDMDTWGGRADAALDIARLLKTDLNDVHTICYVRTRAISAGALISLACDEIIMTRVGTLGDCAPIVLGQKLEGVEREKGESPLRTEFRESAELNGYPMALAESMVSWDLEVWLIRNVRTRELRYVLRQEWAGRVQIPSGVTSGPSNPNSDWEVLRVVVPTNKLLTMTSSEAEAYGFASALVEAPSEAPFSLLMKRFNVVGEPVVLEDNWSEKLVGFLTSPYVLSLLFFVAVLCAYIEINTPGFGIPGSIAIVCFAIIFGSRFLVGLATWWETAIFVVGLALIAVEVFLIPGFGITGILGILCCIVGMFAILIANAPDKWPIPKTDLDWSILEQGLFGLGAGLLGAIVVGLVVSRFLPKVPGARRLVLGPAKAAVDAPVMEESPMRRINIGDMGVVESMCRPVGKARFGDDLLDAASEGGVIEAGSRVRVLRRDGNRLIVEKVEQA